MRVKYVRVWGHRPLERGIYIGVSRTWTSWSIDFKFGGFCNFSDPRCIYMSLQLLLVELAVEINRGPA